MPTTVPFQKKIASFDFSYTAILAMAKRRRYFTISIFSWLVILILAAVILVPSIQTILEARAELSTAAAELDTKQQLITSLQSLDTQDIARANKVLAAALPIEKPVLPVLYSVDRLAAQAQVSVSDFQVSPGLLGTSSGKLETQVSDASLISPKLATLPLKMNVAGGFDSLSKFFQSLDNVVPFIQINSIEFSTDNLPTSVSSPQQTQSSSSAQYSAEVALSSLYLKSALPSGDVKSIVPLNSKELSLLDRLTIANNQREQDTLNVALPTAATTSGIQFLDPNSQ